MEHKVRELTKCPQSELRTLNQDLRYFKSDLKKKWESSNYMEERFIKRNEDWLNTSISIHSWTSSRKSGRPPKDFRELSDRSKRRRTKNFREQIPVDQLTYAASVSQRAAGNTDASKFIKGVTASPTRAKKYREVIVKAQKTTAVKKHSPIEALSIFVEGDFNRKQWELLHNTNKSIYPCYTLLREAKKSCYPEEESIRVTEISAEIRLQELLDHTTKRLCLYLNEVLEKSTDVDLTNMELVTKWGCDGCQQTPFQQKFSDSSFDDSSIFQSSLVPLRLQACTKEKKTILWQNPTPSSTRFCRPIRIRFLHETAEVTKEEIKYVEDQAKNLLKTKISTSKGVSKVSHILLPTMVDAKVCNSATSTASTMRCYICGKTSKDFNDFEKANVEDPQALRFGLSILHARIRLFESLIHLAYKLPLKKWQVRTPEEKRIVKENKEKIQKEYKEKTGLIIDMPKHGFGNSNSGNTSRRFFSDPELAAEITGINIKLIERLRVILEAISSGHKINIQKFESYTKATAKIYVELYGWHPMTPTLHKILIHGATVIKHSILPIGQLSEEAAEARNKHFRLYRQDFARKFNRIQCNRDVLNRLLLTSDPFLSCKRKRQPKKSLPFAADTLELLEAEEAEEP